MVRDFVPKFGGMYYMKADKLVLEDLKERGFVYRIDEYTHSVPHCWRCATRLFYGPQDAWFVNVQELKEQLKKTNEEINWFPGHFKHGRFLKSLENAPDWNISRNRYWGSPVPVWECACGERFVPGSIKELEEASGKTITDLHKPEIDEVTVLCKKCGKQAHRVPEVLDSWIEAGSASFGERHYPFGEQPPLESFYPPDFISEYTGQIRAWFYVLHVIANALNLRSDGQNLLSRNVSVTGVFLGTVGRKMSKNFKNYPDPKEMLQKFGGDALRLYLLGSPVMNGEDILIAEEPYRNQVRGLLLVLWNVYKFFITYANLNKFKPQEKHEASKNILDIWIVSLLNKLIVNMTDKLDSYDTVSSINLLNNFVQDLSTWYLRRSRSRASSMEFLNTLHHVLVTLTKLLAPITPFTAEEMYKNLTEDESVHLADWPKADESKTNKELETYMEKIRKVAEKGHKIRKEKSIRVRQPLGDMFYSFHTEKTYDPLIFIELLKEELNVKGVMYSKEHKLPTHKGTWEIATDPDVSVGIDLAITDELGAEGEMREIVREIQAQRKKLGTKLSEVVDVQLTSWPKEFEDEIKTRALVDKISKGEDFKIIRK